MRRGERGSDLMAELIKTIEIKNKEGRIVERKEVVSVKGLLHLAHAERLSAIHTRLVQSPTKDNGETAIALVRVRTARGSFSGLGDANPRKGVPRGDLTARPSATWARFDSRTGLFIQSRQR